MGTERTFRKAVQRLRGSAVQAPPPAPEIDPTAVLPASVIPPQTDPADRRILEQCMPLSMTGAPRLQALIDTVRYCEQRGVPGAYAECGVWLGGSVLAMVLTLQELGVDDRDVFLYDTFEGMPEPSEHDTSPLEAPALETWKAAEEQGSRAWDYFFEHEGFQEERVRETLLATGYPAERIHLVRGPVEETIPERAPDAIALLRLDTDWYESTRHELVHLFPRLSPAGALIIDDYGHWDGSRRAVDEYFSTEAAPLMLTRVDYSARIAVKA
jgi:hypothetical protein